MLIHSSGIILHKSKWSETSAIVHIFSGQHGIVKGIVKGGFNAKNKVLLEVGNLVDFKKYFKSSDSLGTLAVEGYTSYFKHCVTSNVKLLVLNCLCQMSYKYLLELVDYSAFYNGTLNVLNCLSQPTDIALQCYLKWELDLLAVIGYGLDLTTCAVTFKAKDLKYISPKTGKAVSSQAGLPYASKLLPFPKIFSTNNYNGNMLDYAEAFKVTSYFFNKYNASYNKQPDFTRDELIKVINKKASLL